jgi:predicted TPR repeat methyltransferase
LAAEPDYLEARNNLGNVFQEMGRPEQAAACFERVLSMSPDSATGHAGLAAALQAQGRLREAAAHYEQASRLNPDDVHTRHMLAAMGGAPTPATAAPDYVSKLFDKYADHFDEHLVEKLGYRTPEHLNDAVRRALGDRRERLDVIDLGCGTGLCGPLFRDLAGTLTGVDLSPKMIDKARDRRVYDNLFVGDITSALQPGKAIYDLVIAADVFVYIGELAPVFEACSTALHPGGLFAFSVEAAEEDVAYALRATGRYAHSTGYIRKLAQAVGFNEISHTRVVLRKEKDNPLPGYIFVLAHP